MDINNKFLLFAQIAQGEKRAFDIFYEHYQPRLVQFANIFLRDFQQAEDVVSEVLIYVVKNRKHVFSLDHCESYLYAAVKNKSLTAIKKQDKLDNFSQKPENFIYVSENSSNPHELLEEQELKCFLNTITQDFPPKRKMVFHLIREDGLSYRQVAEIMDISERTVEVHLKLAIKTLRNKVEKYLGKKKTSTNLQKLVKIFALAAIFLEFSVKV